MCKKKRYINIHNMKYGIIFYRNTDYPACCAEYNRADEVLISYSTSFYPDINTAFIQFNIGKIKLEIHIFEDGEYSFTFAKTTTSPNGMKQTISYKGSAKHDKEGNILKFPRFADN